MKFGFQHLVYLGLPFLLSACGSDTPSFVEKPEGIIKLTVDSAAADEDSFDMDELMSEDELSADATAGVIRNAAYAGEYEVNDEDELADMEDVDDMKHLASKKKGAGGDDFGDDELMDEDAEGKGPKAKEPVLAETDTSRQSADATPITNTPDSGAGTGSTGSSGSTPDSGYDSKSVAKACLPHFRGLSQKIKVIDTSAPNSMRVAPGTVIAFKLTGNYSTLNIYLPAGSDLPGVCFFVAGNHADVKFSTASSVDGFAYVAAGNQSSGAIEFLGGSPVRSHIDLKGNQAALSVTGLDSNLCQGANLNGNAPRFQCNP